MGYRVEYHPIHKIRRAETRRVNRPALIAVFFLLFLLLVNGLWPRGAEILQGGFFSGDRAVTAAALENLASDLKEGTKLSWALEDFCRSVIGEAEIAAN